MPQRVETMTTLPIVHVFQLYLTNERHFSPYTARCYGVDLRQYTEFLTDEFNIECSRDDEQKAYERRLHENTPQQQHSDTNGEASREVLGTVGRHERPSTRTATISTS